MIVIHTVRYVTECKKIECKMQFVVERTMTSSGLLLKLSQSFSKVPFDLIILTFLFFL